LEINKRSFSSGGSSILWGAELKDKNGRLIVRMCSVEPPVPMTCTSFSCLKKFYRDTVMWGLLTAYHSRRIAYAQTNRNKEILERYRTGEPSPKTIWQGIHANIKLKCPVCRKYNIDPFLGGQK